MSTVSVSLDPSQYVRVNIGKNPILIQSFRDSVRVAFSESQPAKSNTAFHLLTPDHPPLRWDATDINVWALATSDRCGMSITEAAEDPLTKAGIIDISNTARTPDITAPTDSSPYTGEWSLNTGFNAVQVTMAADVAGDLYFDFFDDNEVPTGGSAPTSTFPVNGFSYNGAGFNIFHQAVKGVRYFRARFVPDDASCTTFRINSYFLKNLDLSNAPMNQALSRVQDAIITRGVLPADEIAIGLRSGVSHFNKFAYRDVTSSSAGEQTVWASNTNFTPITTTSTFTIAYNNATDGSGTTGATILQISYLDSDEKLQTTIHVLGSTGSDVTSFSGLGINRVVVASSGSANSNTNDITLTATTGGSVQAIVPALGSVTQQSILHFPDNAVGIVKNIMINCNKLSGSSPKVQFKMYAYSRIVNTQFELFRITIDTSVENTFTLVDPVGFPFSRRDIVYFTMDTDSNNTIASVRYSAHLYNDD